MNALQTDTVRVVRRSYRPAHQCECHPWTEDDARVWQIVKALPRTQAQWERLHDLIERERRMLIEDYRATQVNRETCPLCDGDGFGPQGSNCPRCGGGGKVVP